MVSACGTDGHIWYRGIEAWGAAPGSWQGTPYEATSAPTAAQQLTGWYPASIGPAFLYRGADWALYHGVSNTPVLERRGGVLTSAPDRDNPGGFKRLGSPDGPGETTSMVVARDIQNRLAVYNFLTDTWTNLGGVVT